MPVIMTFVGALFGQALGFVLRVVVIKFVLFTAIYLLISTTLPILMDTIMPPMAQGGDGGITAMLGQFSDSAWYFIEWMQIVLGLKLILAAFVGRFILRRIHWLN